MSSAYHVVPPDWDDACRDLQVAARFTGPAYWERVQPFVQTWRLYGYSWDRISLLIEAANKRWHSKQVLVYQFGELDKSWQPIDGQKSGQ